MPIYIDANVFYNAYCPIEERITADWLLKQVSSEFIGITSEWTIAEIFRAFKKPLIPHKLIFKMLLLKLNLNIV